MATRWRLETCACVLTYESLTADGDPVEPVVENDCGAHGRDLSPGEHFRKVLESCKALSRLALN